VGMIPEASRFSAGIRGNYSEVNFDETDLQPAFTNRLSRLELRAAFNLSRAWQLNGYVGEEDNIFLSAAEDIDGEYWDAGVRWTPHSRLTLDLGYGERFFGDAPRFSIDYQHKRHFLRASYLRDLQFPRDIRAAGNVAPDDPLDPGLGLPGQPLPGAGGPTFIGQGPVLNENFVLAYRFQARRSTLQLSLSDSQQTFSLDGRQADFQSANVTVTRTLGPTITADLALGWTKNQGNLTGGVGPGVDQGLETLRASLGLQQRLARRTTLSLRYSYTDQESNFSGFGFTFEEHRVELGLRFDYGRE
jgi:hypothetical protein